MTDPNTIAEHYLSLWNDSDDSSRRAQLAEQWTDDASYIDPMINGFGREGVATMIEGARKQFPGHSFVLAGTPDGHGDYVRFSWMLAPEEGAPIACGTDIVRLDVSGRIAEVIGFLDGTAA